MTGRADTPIMSGDGVRSAPASVVHRRYVTQGDAHYQGGLVNGAFVLGLFGDAATELCIRTDGDEGLFASYSDVQFVAPIRAGDVVEVEATLVSAGQRSRRVGFEARIVCRSAPERGESAATALIEPVVVCTAEGTVVVPAESEVARRDHHENGSR